MAVAQLLRNKITDEALMRLPKDGRKWELVDGRLQEVATSAKHDQIVIWLGRLIGPYADDFGILTASQAGFRMRSGNVRLPDFAFTRYDRFPNGEAPDGFVEFAPDLAVEIISPSKNPPTWPSKWTNTSPQAHSKSGTCSRKRKRSKAFALRQT